MNVATKIKELTQYPYEEEWFEFKENLFNADEVGEYISALAVRGATAQNRCAEAEKAVDDWLRKNGF